MNIVFWILMVMLVLVFVSTLLKSTEMKYGSYDRILYLVVAVVCFVLIIVLHLLWR